MIVREHNLQSTLPKYISRVNHEAELYTPDLLLMRTKLSTLLVKSMWHVKPRTHV